MIKRSGVTIRCIGNLLPSPSPSPSPSQSQSQSQSRILLSAVLIPNYRHRSFHTYNCRYNPLWQWLQQPHQQQRVILPSASASASASFTTTSSPSATASEKNDSNEDKSNGGGGIRGWMNDRRDRQEKERYMEQMTRLSNMDVFSMENYRDELSRGVDGGGIMTKISFMQTKEVKQAKEVVEVVEKMIEVVGPDATAEDLIEMDRLQRLRVATAANKSLEDISIMVSQITNMDVMQKTLRKRRLEGKPIPVDKDYMQAIIQKDAVHVLSKSQKEMLKSRQVNHARKMARRRR